MDAVGYRVTADGVQYTVNGQIVSRAEYTQMVDAAWVPLWRRLVRVLVRAEL